MRGLWRSSLRCQVVRGVHVITIASGALLSAAPSTVYAADNYYEYFAYYALDGVGHESTLYEDDWFVACSEPVPDCETLPFRAPLVQDEIRYDDLHRMR